MTNIEKYLNSVVDYLVKHPHEPTSISFSDYCKNEFGLTDDEIEYVFHRYKFLLGWVSYDESGYYLNKILNNY